MSKQYKIIALVFLAIFLISVIPSLTPTAQIQSQTREVRPQAFGASTTIETDVATAAPYYTIGSSQSGTYVNTQISDGSYHISVTVTDGAWSNPLLYAGSGSDYGTSGQYQAGTLTWIEPASIVGSPDGHIAWSYETSYLTGWTHWLRGYNFGFNIPTGAKIMGMQGGYYAEFSGMSGGDYVKEETSGWTDASGNVVGVAAGGGTTPSGNWQTYYSWFTDGSSTTMWGLSFTPTIINSANFGFVLQAKLVSVDAYLVDAYVDSFKVTIWYSYSALVFSYPFRFIGGIPSLVSNMSFSAKGKTNASAVVMQFRNYVSLGWDNVGSFNTTDTTYTATANWLLYLASNGSMTVRFDYENGQVPITVSVDYLAFTITYTPTGTPSYASLIPAINPTYTIGTVTGGFWQTWTENASYQISTSGWYPSSPYDSTKKFPLSNGIDDSAVGTMAWTATSLGGIKLEDGTSYAVWDTSAASTVSHYLRAVNFSLSIPATATIVGIQVGIKRCSEISNITASDYSVRLYKSGAGYIGANLATTTLYPYATMTWVYYGNSSYLWGAGMTAADLNNVNSGFALSSQTNTNLGRPRVDVMSMEVWYTLPVYKLDCYYQMQFTATTKANVYQLGWLLNGKVSGNALTIYLYNWGSSVWDSTSLTLTTTQADQQQSSVSVANYMAANGSIRIRFYLDSQAASFTLSLDFLRVDVIYAFLTNTAPPSAPVLLTPANGTVVDPYVVSFSWLNSTQPVWTNASTPVINLYHIQIATDPAFSNVYLDKTISYPSYIINTTTPLLFQWYYWRAQAINSNGYSSGWSAVYLFFPDTTLSISYYGLDGWGIPFSFPKTLVNGSQYSDPMVHLPNVYKHANITTTDYFGNIISQNIYQINSSTVQYLNIQLNLVQMALKAYGLTVCNITYGSHLNTLRFDTSVTTFLKPGSYTFSGTANNGTITFSKSLTISQTLNAIITLCNPPLLISAVSFSQSDIQFSYAITMSSDYGPTSSVWFKIYDNNSLIVAQTYGLGGTWSKSTVYGLHSLKLQVGDSYGNTPQNFTNSYFVGYRYITFQFYSTIDGLGISDAVNLFQVYVNGSRVWDLSSYATTGGHVFLQVFDYYMSSLYSSVLPYSSVIQIGLGYYQATFANNGENNIVLNSTSDAWALYFNGTDYVSLGIRNMPGTFTIQMWAKVICDGTQRHLFTMGTFDINLGITTSNYLFIGDYDSGGNINYATANFLPYNNTWILITAISRPAGSGWTSQLWVNNVKLDERTYAAFGGTRANTGTTYIGTYAGAYYTKGSISKTLVYSNILSSADISFFYTNKIPQSTSGLFYYYTMSEGTGVSIYDLSGNSYTGTITGATWANQVNAAFVPVKSIPISAQGSTTIRMIAKNYTLVGFGIRTNNALVQFTSTTITVPTSSSVYTYHDLQSAIAFIKYVNANDPNLAAILPINFNTKYYLPSIGAWKWLSPYSPSITMLLNEKANFTVYDNLGSIVISNQQFSYNETIQIPVIVMQVKCKSYGENAFGVAMLHRAGTASGGGQVLLGAGDIDVWYIYPGTYRLDVHYRSVVKNNIIYPLDLWINKSYDITATNYPEYAAGFLIANSSTKNIIDVLNTQEQGLTDIKIQLYPGGEIYTHVTGASNALSNIGQQTNLFGGGSMTVVGILASLIPGGTIIGWLIKRVSPPENQEALIEAKARKRAQKVIDDFISHGTGPTVTPDSTGTRTHVGRYPPRRSSRERRR